MIPSTAVELSVPGNLLLLGEYAVLEPGGRGLALAVEPRVRLEASPSSTLHVEGSWPGRSGDSPFVSSAVRVVSDFLGTACTGRVMIDSSGFFSPDGRKAGYGSSAAVSVALVCALLALGGREPAARGPEAAVLALRAHRLAQDGRGSGYDVLASFNGGCGVVRGGTDPSWEPCALPAGTGVVVFPGPGPVSTPDAVGRYDRWKKDNPEAARDFLRDSGAGIGSFLSARSAEESLAAWSRLRELGIALGRAIDVPAEIAVPAGLDPRWCKALGAGDELGVCLLPAGTDPPAAAAGLRRVEPSPSGVKWLR